MGGAKSLPPMRNARLAEVYRDMPEKYPYQLEERFARIVNRIAELWETPQLEHYFDDLLVDRRGGRQGFPAEVMSNIMSVHAVHAAIVTAKAVDPNDPWGFEAARKGLKELGVECTPRRLLRAVESGDVSMLEKLIRAGLDVNHVGEAGWTPLMVAAFNGREGSALVLIQAGAIVNARDKARYTPLHWAAMNGYVDVTELLLRKAALVNAQNDFGWTPLLHGAGRGHEGVVRTLLDGGALPSLADKEGWTPLHKAAVNGHLAIVELLLQAGADWNLVHKEGATALMLATEKGHTAVRAALIARAEKAEPKPEAG